ncbi:hypothetical protein [Desulfosporosinus sp. BICA1-9]|uniref:hypothetical protein n=1 Tax=Desulfosporosinus sp. BICA1-9 TaxID=1531958 RepID=UPI00054C20A0|nr:hypothetical protein [Desulfosporosinus sp. BICA1-9]KJS48879.1 MAG: hypothetical protein VR66_11670 [Peptococcaceae bacterium BRH_c23]KJS85771.1 MAG: hypothetical protein JL57_18095 [Desulfosporosinus sp. BICA1-9]
MENSCGTTKANVFETTEVNGIPVYYGAGVNPVNSPAQFFVAWGKGVLASGLIHTFNSQSEEQGALWFIDEDEAEAQYNRIQKLLAGLA